MSVLPKSADIGYITKKEKQYIIRREAQLENIIAAKAVAETVKSSFGPRGLDKMLVDTYGHVTITNSGFVILDKMKIPHPAAGIMVEIARSLYEEVGDGTISAVILAGELLSKAEELLKMGIHPQIIAEGYEQAATRVLRSLDHVALKVEPTDREILRQVAMTAAVDELPTMQREFLADLAVEAVLSIRSDGNSSIKVDLDDIKIEGVEGEPSTSLVEGVVFQQEVTHTNMPKRVEDARIALVNFNLRLEKPHIESVFKIANPRQFEDLFKECAKRYRDMVQKVVETGANVLISQQGIEHMASHYLARAGILAVKRAYEWDMKKLAKATGGKVVAAINDLTPEDLGYAKVVEETKMGKERYVVVEGCRLRKSMTILIRRSFKESAAETERVIRAALGVVRDVVEEPYVVVDGGALELEIAKDVREWASAFSGKKRLAIERFADALEIIPITLAESCGLEPLAVMTKLRASHKRGEKWAGVNVPDGKIDNVSKLGLLAPAAVKKQIIKSATEASIMILRVDSIIAEHRLTPDEMGKMTSKAPRWRPSGIAGIPRIRM